MREALERAGIRVATCDLELRYTWLGTPLPGFCPSEVIGRRDDELWPPVVVADLVAFKQAALGAGKPTATEITLPEGLATRSFDVRAEPLRDPDGRVAGLHLTMIDITGRQEAARQALDGVERTRALLGVIREGVVLHDGQRIIEVNEALCRMFGLPWEQVLGRDPLSLIAPEDKPFVKAQTAAQARGPDEIRGLKPDGSVFPIEVEVERIVEGGRVLRAVLVRDLTAQHRSEAALRESEARYRALAAATREGVIIHDGRQIVEVNEAFCRLHATTRHEAIGRPAYDFIAPEALSAALAAITSGTMGPYETTARRVDGSTFPIEAAGQPMVYRGRLMRVATLRDLTERREAEAALRDSEARFRGFAEATQDVLWIADATGRLEYLSPAYETVWGEPRALMMQDSRRWMEFLHPDDRQRVQGSYAATLSGERLEIEYRILRPDGTLRWIRDIGFPITDGAGRVYRVAGLARDVTRRKQTEEHQQLLLGELNHRVKNTLATVQSIARQTLRHAPSPDVFQERFEDRLLALSQTHNLLTQENWQHGSLTALLKQELSPYGKGRYHLDGASEVRLAPRSIVALGMALHELTTNAAKHGALSREAGRLAVRWRIENEPRQLVVEWEESGGPPVAGAPKRHGFGSRLLERGITAELGGSVTLDYAPKGLRARIAFPLDDATLPLA
jgi:PAS domain S-box-containing protein